MIWYMIWYDMIWYNTIDTIRYDMIYDMIWYDMIWYDMIWYGMIWYHMTYLLTAIGLTPGGSSSVHIYTQTIHRTTQLTQTIRRKIQITNWEECGLCSVFATNTLAFAWQMRKKHGKTSVSVAEECQLARWKRNIQNRTYITMRMHEHDKNT